MAPRNKSSPVISAADVFDAPFIERLAGLGKLPASADLDRFGEGVREAARIYVRDSGIPNANEVNREITKLHRAAEKRGFETVAELLGNLSPRARSLLNDRGSRRTLGLALPETEALHAAETQVQACATIVRLCALGGRYVQGRRRPSGRRSWTWRPYLHAPNPRRQPPRREAELYFLICLELAWLEAVGKPPSRGANPHDLGPFARAVKECLHRVGASHVDTPGLMNELNRRRRSMESCRPA